MRLIMVGKIYLRVEAFSLTNTPPVDQPNGAFGSAAFVSITTADDPRVFKFVARVKF
jgi:hypothetical protein